VKWQPFAFQLNYILFYQRAYTSHFDSVYVSPYAGIRKRTPAQGLFMYSAPLQIHYFASYIFLELH